MAGGCVVAFFWTIFPYPITVRSKLRQDIGHSVYLLTEFYSCVHTTARLMLLDQGGDMNIETSPRRKVDKFRHRVFAKQIMLLKGLRQTSAATVWEPFGGKFPKKTYDDIITRVEKLVEPCFISTFPGLTYNVPDSITNYTSLIAFALGQLSPANAEANAWFNDVKHLITSFHTSSNNTTSVLAQLASSLSNGRPLTPHLSAPTVAQPTTSLSDREKDIVLISQITDLR